MRSTSGAPRASRSRSSPTSPTPGSPSSCGSRSAECELPMTRDIPSATSHQRRSSPASAALCLAVLAGASSLVWAQNGAQPDNRLRQVQAGTSDANPLAASSRALPADLRLPIGFDKVYKLESASRGRSLGGDLYARRSGGITAVFPRSQYEETSQGLMPDV